MHANYQWFAFKCNIIWGRTNKKKHCTKSFGVQISDMYQSKPFCRTCIINKTTWKR